MSGKNDFRLNLGRAEINEIRNLMDEVSVKNEYVQLDYIDYQIVRVLEAYKLFLSNRGLEPDYEVSLSEKE